MTDRGDPQPTRRERQREATYDEIVGASRELLAEGAELSLRAVAGRMGMTAPALYRYVAQLPGAGRPGRLRDRQGRDRAVRRGRGRPLPEDDHAGRLVRRRVGVPALGAGATRASSRLVFANPVADSDCVRRELLTAVDLRATTVHRPAAARLGSTTIPDPDARRPRPGRRARRSRDPLIPAKVERTSRPRTAACSGSTCRAGRRSTAWSRSRCSATYESPAT